MEINYINGNLITLAKEGAFDVIIQGCNCYCKQKAGLALQMSENFGTDNPNTYKLEADKYKGDINKLGQIEYVVKMITSKGELLNVLDGALLGDFSDKPLIIVNCYTQYDYGYEKKPFDYDAFTLCMRKLNHKFKGKHIGTARIGCHLGGGSWFMIEPIVKRELKDCSVTVVDYVN